MKALLQRVLTAKVIVEGIVVGEIDKGLCVFLGVTPDDTDSDITWLVDKLINLRIFEDKDGKMNKSLLDEQGKMLIVSQFTLCGSCKKGRRPSFTGAADAKYAEEMYERFTQQVIRTGIKVQTGRFQTHMNVELNNDGPVTLMIDTKE
ncbi:MAG: D-aminoacyl-tRNA deacylase [Synergistaceae bacterium]